MDRTRAVALYILYRRERKKKRNRTLWVHDINMKREEVGLFKTLFEDLKSDDGKFFNFIRMLKSTFHQVLGRVKGHLQRQNTQMRNCIQPEEMLAVTIRYLASGCTFTDLHYTFRIGISTASLIVRKVCSTIWTVMKLECLPIPNKEQWTSIAAGFEKKANFPHCIGAVDGKHIRLICPRRSGSMYFNYKVADSDYRFVYVNVGSYGKDCDSSIFQRGELWTSIESGKLELPSPTCLPGTSNPEVPYFLIGDEAFGLHKHLLRPFGGRNLTHSKRNFNYRLSRARRYVECTFGIMTNKWRILHRPINVEPDFAVDIVKCCVILHNFVRDRDGFVSEDTMEITGLDDLRPQNITVRGTLTANNTRNVLSEYFNSDVGSVPWQTLSIK